MGSQSMRPHVPVKYAELALKEGQSKSTAQLPVSTAMSIQELTVFEALDKPPRGHFENRNAGARLPRYK
jgi:hypothetical protein